MDNKYKSAYLVGERIRRFREEQNMSQEELAFESDIHSAYIGKIERGEKCPTIETLYKISKGLNIPISVLTDIDNYYNPTEEIDKIFKVRLENAMSGLNYDQLESIVKIVEEISKYMM